MISSREIVDIENQKSSGAISTKIAIEGDTSVGSDDDDFSDDRSVVVDNDKMKKPSTKSTPSSVWTARHILLLMIVAAILGFSIGLGLGLHEPKRQEMDNNPTSEDAEMSGTTTTSSEGKTSSVEPREDTKEEKPIEMEIEPESDASDAVSNNTFIETKPPSLPIEVDFWEVDESLRWPELVGLPGEEAKQFIEDLNQGFDAVVKGPKDPITRDFLPSRVIIYVDEEGYVEKAPAPGR